jgi:hypothetical protein
VSFPSPIHFVMDAMDGGRLYAPREARGRHETAWTANRVRRDWDRVLPSLSPSPGLPVRLSPTPQQPGRAVSVGEVGPRKTCIGT